MPEGVSKIKHDNHSYFVASLLSLLIEATADSIGGKKYIAHYATASPPCHLLWWRIESCG